MPDAALPLALLLFVLAVVPAWLWGPPLWRALRRARVAARPFPPAWREVLRRRMPLYARLPPDLQLRLRRTVQVLLAENPVIGCDGLVVDDEHRVLVAAHAALLVLQRGAAAYEGALTRVLLYPSAFVAARREEGAGLVHESQAVLLGEAWGHGTVVLSWPDVVAGAADPDDGENVALHEFAHALDHAPGRARGAPWLPGGVARRRQWAAVMGAAFALERSRAADERITSDYALTSPAEFFAVLAERYFERPRELAAQLPAAFLELRRLFAVDPLLWPDSPLGSAARSERDGKFGR